MEKETEQNVWLKGKHYVDSIRSLYYGATPDVIANVYPLWKDVFIEVHGNLDSQRKVDLVALSEEYGIHLNGAEDLFKLLFCLETYYSIILRLLVSKKYLAAAFFRSMFLMTPFIRDSGSSIIPVRLITIGFPVFHHL